MDIKDDNLPDQGSAAPESIELMHRVGGLNFSKRQRNWMIVGLSLLLLLIPLQILFFLDTMSFDRLFDAQAWSDSIGAFKEIDFNSDSDFSDPLNLFVFLVVVPLALLAAHLQGNPQLHITGDGIRKSGARVDSFLGVDLNWSISILEIESLDLVQSAVSSSAGAKVKIRLRNEEIRTLNTFQWLESGDRELKHNLREAIENLRYMSREGALEKIMKSPLIVSLQTMGYQLHTDSESKKKGALHFDLSKNKVTATSVLFITMTLLAAVLALFVGGERYVAGYPFKLLAVIGVASGALVLVVNLIGRVPRLIAFGVAAIATITGATAAYPALLYLNASTDKIGLQSIQYVHSEERYYKPMDANWPDIKLPRIAHQANNSPGVPLEVLIRKGGLGFYQADFEPLIPDQ